ncbi:hypothetical protein Psyaliredsea_28240 [Psychrobacter alimentarius]
MILQDKTSILTDAKARLAQAGIELHVTKKHVKNINFRLKPHTLTVSVPRVISTVQIEQAVAKRVPWAIANHAQVLEQYKRKQHRSPDSLNENSNNDSPLLLWGCTQPFVLNHDEKMAYYRQQLADVLPALFEKWQPVVGATANEIRLKKCTHAGAVVTQERGEFGCLPTCQPIRLNAPSTLLFMSYAICIRRIIALPFGKRWRQRCQITSAGIIYWQVKRDS